MRTKKILFAIFILALALRLFAVAAHQELDKPLYADARIFDNMALNITLGHGFSHIIDGSRTPTTHRTPLYSMFLSGIYFIFGHNYIAVKIIQAILGALSCIVIFFIADAIYNNRIIGIIAALITAFYKPFISGFNYYGGPALILSECFYMFMVGVTVLMTILFIKKESKKFGILSGIFIGLAILTRPEFVLYPIFLIVYLFFLSRFSMKCLKKYIILFLFVVLTLTPWVVRNYITQGKFIPLSTLGGFLFWEGNNSFANGGWAYPEDYDEIMYKTKDMTEYERNKIYFNEGMEELKSNPGRIPKLLMRKVLVHWAPFEEGFKMFNPYYVVIFLFGSIGILFFRKRTVEENALLIVFLATTATAIIIFGDPRYRYPYESFLIIFAALAIKEIFDFTKRKVLYHGKHS